MGNAQTGNGAPGGLPPGVGGSNDIRGPQGLPPGTFPPGGYVPSQGTGQSYPPAFQTGDRQEDLKPSSSDASMTIMDGDQVHQAVGPQAGPIENWLDDDSVPTVFRWEHGGRQVYIMGTFNGWSRPIPMHRSGNDFTYIHNLQRRKHAFNFIVDDERRFAPDQPTVAGVEGRINNFIDVTNFKAYTGDKDFEKEKAAAEYGVVGTVADEGEGEGEGESGTGTKADKDGEVFSHSMPDVDDYTTEPPPLPPHLPRQRQDTAALPVPQHVELNHLYCSAIKDYMMVSSITQRFKTKFVTTVYYSPCASK